MAYASNTIAQAGFADRIAGLFADIKARRAQARVYNTTLNELSALSVRDLADLGIDPSNVKSIAYEAAYGK